MMQEIYKKRFWCHTLSQPRAQMCTTAKRIFLCSIRAIYSRFPSRHH